MLQLDGHALSAESPEDNRSPRRSAYARFSISYVRGFAKVYNAFLAVGVVLAWFITLANLLAWLGGERDALIGTIAGPIGTIWCALLWLMGRVINRFVLSLVR